MNELIRSLRLKAGLTQSQLGDRVGVQKDAVSKWETGKTRPDRETTVRVAKALGVPPAVLLARMDAELSDDAVIAADIPQTGDTFAGPSFATWPRDIPVYGVVVGGGTGDFALNGEIVDFLRRPPSLMGAKHAFGLYVTGDSMEPRFTAGDPILINPSRPPAPGDDVIIEMKPAAGDTAGPAFVKRLVRRTASSWVAKQFNPPMEIEYPAASVLRVLRISPWREIVGT